MSTTKKSERELTDEERVHLIELNGKLASLESEARVLREQRKLDVVAALERGASQRAIAEALGLTQQAVALLVR